MIFFWFVFENENQIGWTQTFLISEKLNKLISNFNEKQIF